jgi:hypothetical protein
MPWLEAIREELDGWMSFLVLLAVGCAGVLVLAVAAPGEIARTTWTEVGPRGSTRLTDSPAGYVGLMSLGGLVAGVALVVAAWSLRARLVAALVAAGAFLAAVWVAIRYAYLLGQGVMGSEGRLDTTGWSAGYVVQPPALLPVLILVAIGGALLALLYAAVWWPRRAEREHF